MKKVVLFKSQSEDYQNAFSEKNYEVIFIEPLHFIFMNSEELNKKLQRNDYDGLLLTSPRAIEAVSMCWDPAKFVIWNTKRVYTVGNVSSTRIKCSLGLEVLGSTSGNGENLAKFILSENTKTAKFLFPCGNLRSESLPNLLESQGIQVDSITTYETKENINLRSDLMHLSSLEDHPCCMVFFSPSGCEYIHRQLQTFNNNLSKLPYFAIGSSTAHKIENFGVKIAGIASKPNALSVVESVQKYFER